jgi:hypothetical protein
MRAFLAESPETSSSADDRFGLWIALLELDRARDAAAEIPDITVNNRYDRAAALWLCDIVGGITRPLEPLDLLAEAIEAPDQRVEVLTSLALNRARVALAEGSDWQSALATGRDRLGLEPESLYRRFLSRPTFRALLIATTSGMILFWIGLLGLRPFFPLGGR